MTRSDEGPLDSAGPLGTHEEEDVSRLLDAPWRVLRDRAPSLPRGSTDRRVLQVLAQRELLETDLVRSYLRARDRWAYGDGFLDSERAVELAERLREKLAAAPGELLEAAIAPLAPPDVATEGEEATPPIVTSQARRTKSEPETTSVEPIEPAVSKAGTFRRSFVILSIVLAFCAGLLVRDRLPAWAGRLAPQVFGKSFSEAIDARLGALRRGLAREPSSTARLQSLALFALRSDRHQDALLALQRLVELEPENARALNGLAWLHATSEDPLIHDPIRALAYAERAYAISQEPRIADTLAEAAFMNGDVERAVRLAERNVEQAEGRDYYKRQLARFRAAQARRVD